MKTVELREHPALARIIKLAFPRYAKRKALFEVAETVVIHGTSSDGGSKASYIAVCLSTGVALSEFAEQQSPKLAVPQGTVIVEGGIFCGKPAAAVVTINPADAAKLL